MCEGAAQDVFGIGTGRVASIVRLVQRLAGKPSVPVTLYSKDDCPLCEKAERVVVAVFGRESVRRIDIMGNRELEDAYIFRIPVLTVDEIVLAEGLISMDDARHARDTASRLQKERRQA